MATEVRAQFTFAADNAGNYGGNWANSSNGGFGLGGWGLSVGANTGGFIGSPSNNGMGTSGIGTTSFGAFATGNAFFNASRGLSIGMQVGDSLSFYWAMNWDANGGSKGFDLRSDGTTIFNVNNGGSATITTSSGTANTDYGTTPMLVTLTRISASQYTFSMTSRSGGSTYNATINDSRTINNFNFYIGNQNSGDGNRNFYFNNFAVTNSGVFNQGGTVANANRFTGPGNLSVGNNTTLELTGSGNNNYTGTTTIAAGSTLRFQGSGNSDFASAISGGGTLVMSNGSGQVNLMNNNTAFDGSITIASGSIEAWNTNSLGSGVGTTTVQSGGALRLWNTNSVVYASEALTLNGTGVGGNGGALRNITNNNVWQGNITIGSGTRINSDSGTLTISGTVTGGTNNMFFGGSGNITLSNTISGSQTAGNGAIFKDGSGVLTLSANNSSLSGLIRLREGTISITNGNSLGGGSLELGNGANVATLLVNSNTTIANRVEISDGISAGVINVASGQTATVTGILSQTNGTANTTKFGKDGAGILILNNAGGTYNGQLQIGNGTIVVGATGALGTNNSTSARGIDLGLNVGDVSQGNSVSLLASIGVTVSQSIYVAPNTSSALRTIGLSGSGTNTFNNEIFLDGNLTVDAGTSSTDQVSISGAINNTGSLTKTGAGVLLLSGNNGYTGTTTISAGTLRLGADNRISSQSAISIASGATFDVNGFTDNVGAVSGSGNISLGAGNLTTTVGANAEFNGPITGTGTFTKAGNSTLLLGGNSSNFSGGLTVSTGALRVISANALGNTNGTTAVSAGALLELSNATSMTIAEAITLSGDGGGSGALRNIGGDNTVSGNITLASGARINASTAGSLAISGSISGGANVLYFGGSRAGLISGAISGAGGTQDGTTTSLFKDGPGTLTLSGANTYSGDTRVESGQLTVNAGGNLGNGDSDVFISSGAQLNLNTSVIVDSMRETGTTNGGTINLGAGATLTIDGANKGTLFQNSISGAGNLSVGASGDTSLSLYGTQSYTGSTAVSGGKISTGVALATSGVNVSGSGTFETSAANILSDTATVIMSGGTYALGGSDTVGSFAITGGSLTTTNNSTLTAATYTLQGGTISANLGAGTATASSGTTALNGTFAGNLNVNGGTVNLGGADRISGSSSVSISSGALSLGSFNDTIGSFTISGGALNGTGTLTAASYALQGGTINAVLGAGAVTISSGITTLGAAGRFNAASTLAVNSGQLNLGGNETVAGFSGSGGTLNLGSHTLSANLAATNTFAGSIIGTGGVSKSGLGRLSLSGSSSYSGATAVNAGELNLVGGSIASSAVTVASGASLTGYGSVGALGGAGSVGPGNSPGIITATQIIPTGGLDFNFEFTGTAPVFSNAASSVNDLIRITGGTPFSGSLSASNIINIYFRNSALYTGGNTPKIVTGGFFTDTRSDFFDSINGATVNYFFEMTGGTNAFNGFNYGTRAQYEAALSNNLTITISTIGQSANFDGPTIDGQILQLEVIPEPSTYTLLALAAGTFAYLRLRRRRN